MEAKLYILGEQWQQQAKDEAGDQAPSSLGGAVLLSHYIATNEQAQHDAIEAAEWKVADPHKF
jgi:hypothetical protein